MKVVCSTTSYKTFLLCCNVALLFVGLSVFFLGLKMKWAMAILLIDIPIVLKAIKAVIATGFFISFAGISGIGGSCYESVWLLFVHLVSLGVIVIMEFSLGVTLMIVKKTIENAMDSTHCNNICAASVDAIILDYALPSAGLMMSIIFVEALMIFCSIKLYFHFRDLPKSVVSSTRAVSEVQHVPMQNVAAQQTMYGHGHLSLYAPQMGYTAPRRGYVPSQFVLRGMEIEAEEMKPPDYNSLQLYQRPLYFSSSLTSNYLEDAETTRPKEPEGLFYPV